MIKHARDVFETPVKEKMGGRKRRRSKRVDHNAGLSMWRREEMKTDGIETQTAGPF